MPEDTTIEDALARDAGIWAPDVTVHDFTARDRVQFRKATGDLEPEPDPEWPYGRVPRTNWPGAAVSHWTSEIKAEREWWVRELYTERGYTMNQLAEALNLGGTTLGRVIGELGIGRRRPGTQAPSQQRLAQRRAKVKELIEQGLSYDEIGKQLGLSVGTVGHDAKYLGLNVKVKMEERRAKLRVLWEEDPRSYGELADILGVPRHTIQTDMQVMGLGRRLAPPPKHRPSADIVDRAIHQLDEMAQFLLGQEGLELVDPTPEQAQEWELSLKRLSRVNSRLRQAIKGAT